MVFRRTNRNQNSLRPVNRIKHVIDVQGATVAGTQSNNLISVGVDNPVQATTTDCAIGSKVNGFFIVAEVYATTSVSLANCYFGLFKNVGGNLTNPPLNLVGINDNKRYMIHQEMVMLQKQDDSNPRTLFKGVIAVPRGYRRIGPQDQWVVSFLAPGVNIDFCFQVHYKEFR